jgi:hypothetical protein
MMIQPWIGLSISLKWSDEWNIPFSPAFDRLCLALKVMTRRFGKCFIIKCLAKVAVITFKRFRHNDVKVMTVFL